MTFLILLVLNFIFCLALFLYFRERMNRHVSGTEWKQEMGTLITLFNRNADEQISLLDDRIRQFHEIKNSLELEISEYKKLSLMGPRNEKKVLVREEKPDSEKTRTVKKPERLETLSVVPRGEAGQLRLELAESGMDDREDRIRSYLGQKEDEGFEELNLSEKIRFLHRRRFSERAIAVKLGVSLDEIQLAIQKV